MSGWEKKVFELTRAEIWFLHTKTLYVAWLDTLERYVFFIWYDIWVFYSIWYDIDTIFWPLKWPFCLGFIAWEPFFQGNVLTTFLAKKRQKITIFQYQWYSIWRIRYSILFDTVKRLEISAFDRYSIRYSQLKVTMNIEHGWRW